MFEESLVTDFLIETKSGYKLDHVFIQINHVQPEDLPLYQSVIESKTKTANRALEAEQYDLVLMLISPSHRIKYLCEYAVNQYISNSRAWRIARDTWINQNSVFPNTGEWEQFFELDIPLRQQNFMNEKERNHLSQMPSEIKIYRGYDRAIGRSGLSWSLSKMIASQYANRFKSKIIAQAVVGRDSVMGYINARGHHEIVLKSRLSLENQKAVNAVRPKPSTLTFKN